MPKGPRFSFSSQAGLGWAAPRVRSLTALLIGSTALTAVALTPAVHAGTPVWVGNASNDWFTGGDWNPQAVPNAADAVIIDTTSPNSTVINGATAASHSVSVGDANNGSLTISNGGILNNTDVSLGGQVGSTGTLTVTGAGSSLNNARDLIVGNLGTGTLAISQGGGVTTDNLFVGSVGSGTVSIDGLGSQLSVVGGSALVVGYLGSGALSVTAGGVLTSAGGGIGFGGGSTGNVTVSGVGSLWTDSGIVYVGGVGNGRLTIANGANMSSGGGINIGVVAGSSGSVTVDGAGSVLAINNNNYLYVGQSGTGSLAITNGGVVAGAGAIIGSLAGGTGSVTVDGIGSVWSNTTSVEVGEGGEKRIADHHQWRQRHRGEHRDQRWARKRLGDCRRLRLELDHRRFLCGHQR